MNKYLLVYFGLLLVSGCQSMSVREISSQPVFVDYSKTVSLQQVGEAIMHACEQRHWVAHRVDPNTIIASVSPRGHSATVRIEYDSTKYSIYYVDSENLDYSSEKHCIHSAYNNWVARLDREIALELSRIDDDEK